MTIIMRQLTRDDDAEDDDDENWNKNHHAVLGASAS